MIAGAPRSLVLGTALLLGAVLPSCAAKAPAAPPSLGDDLDREIQTLTGFGFSGAVLVARHGKVELQKGYGLADRAHGTPFTADTLFDIASISKPFTAAAVLRLEMAGKLKVEDRLDRFFPQAPPDKAAITLHQLLSHTSGIAENFGPEYEPLSREAFLGRLFAAPLLFPPGSRFFYSDAGYSLLAAVVEVAAKRPFGEVLRDEVFLPAGMTHSGFYPDAQDRQRLAHGYSLGGDWGTPLDHPWAPDGPWWNLRGNGGVLTTLGDLYRWHQALDGTSVLSPEAKVKYQKPNVPETSAPYPRYAYGWSVTMSPTGHPAYSHVGGNTVFESNYRRFPEDGAVIVTVSNTAGYSAIALAEQIEQKLFGKPVAPIPAVAKAAAPDLARCAGRYDLGAGAGPGESLEVAVEDGRLVVTPSAEGGLELLSGKPGEERQKRFAQRDRKVEKALGAALQGELAPLAELFGWKPADAKERWTATLAPAQGELGAWKGAEAIGTRSLGGQVLTHSRLKFERGERMLDVIWSGPTAENLALSRALRPTAFLPEERGRYFTYDIGTEVVVQLRCVGEGKAAASLQVESAGRTTDARRHGG